MNQRYLTTVSSLAAPGDVIDAKLTLSGLSSDQFAPEYSQSAYKALLSQSTLLHDYTTISKCAPVLITSEKRAEIVAQIFDLHIKKGYKDQTFFIAVSIVDRYFGALAKLGREIPCSNTLMAVIAMLMAAKLE